ncbi:MAG: LamG domain-containing protein, partial [Verrucomicrobiales bacterium]|nr:LamG domain-containing protein [Verrucomicrobiales bacterium]
QESVLLRENEARRFARSGIFPVEDFEEKFARLARAVPLERFDPPVHYVRWSFDEPDGNTAAADSFGPAQTAFNAHLQFAQAHTAAPRVEGVFNRALDFDGQLYVKAAYPGLSGKSPRTVMFWVKIPPDAQLSSAYAMVAWWAENPRFGSRPVHIGWNRNPSEGPVGVLRTDYLGGYALGATPLRDGRWHHIAVVFVPDPDQPRLVEVKQYVDGRLEGEGRPSPPGSQFSTEPNPTVADTLWLGCRLGDTGPRQDRFRGQMDELCVADRALSPRQIVQIMRHNRPQTTALAKVRVPRQHGHSASHILR